MAALAAGQPDISDALVSMYVVQGTANASALRYLHSADVMCSCCCSLLLSLPLATSFWSHRLLLCDCLLSFALICSLCLHLWTRSQHGGRLQ